MQMLRYISLLYSVPASQYRGPYPTPSTCLGGNHQRLLHVPHLRIGVDHRPLNGTISPGPVSGPSCLKLNEMRRDSHVKTMGVKEAPPRTLYAVGVPNLTLRFDEGSHFPNGFEL